MSAQQKPQSPPTRINNVDLLFEPTGDLEKVVRCTVVKLSLGRSGLIAKPSWIMGLSRGTIKSTVKSPTLHPNNGMSSRPSLEPRL